MTGPGWSSLVAAAVLVCASLPAVGQVETGKMVVVSDPTISTKWREGNVKIDLDGPYAEGQSVQLKFAGIDGRFKTLRLTTDYWTIDLSKETASLPHLFINRILVTPGSPLPGKHAKVFSVSIPFMFELSDKRCMAVEMSIAEGSVISNRQLLTGQDRCAQ